MAGNFSDAGDDRILERRLFLVGLELVLVPAIKQAEAWMAEHKVPVVIEVMLERVTNISMGTEIDAINEFEELATGREDAPTAIGLLD